MDTNINNENLETNLEVINKNKNKKIIIASIVTIISLLIVGIIALATTGGFKSKGERFAELLTKEQYVVEMIENRAEDFEEDGETKLEVAIKKKFLSIIDSTFTLLGNDLVLDVNGVKQGENIDVSASLKLGTFELQSLDLIKEDDVIALAIPNLYDNYIAINDENTEEVAKKLGFIDENETDKLDFELLKVINKYGRILVKSISDDIEISNNIKINIKEKSLKTKEYFLSLNEKDLSEIALAILEVLKDDDETIKLIMKYGSENLGDISFDELKQEILNLYNQMLEDINTITNEENILEIKLNVLDNKTVKTTINISGITEIILESSTDNENDYALLTLRINSTALDLKYTGKNDKEKYEGKVELDAGETSITAVELTLEKIKDSTKQVRKIDELNALLLNEATDEELENLRKEIEKNLGIENDEDINLMIYEEGEFKLDNPEARVNILEESVAAYNKLNIGISKEDIIKIMGEPSASFEVNERENMGWYFDENNSIYYISVELSDGKAYKIYNDIVSDMEDNVQVSVELGTQIEDLITLSNDIEYGMTKSDIINILGDKYLEISKDEEGYKTYKWYDKRENILVIEFDNEEKVSYVDAVQMDI